MIKRVFEAQVMSKEQNEKRLDINSLNRYGTAWCKLNFCRYSTNEQRGMENHDKKKHRRQSISEPYDKKTNTLKS